MGAQLETRREELRKRYGELEVAPLGKRTAEELAVEPFHLGSHYSSPPLTSYYLVRCRPFDSLARSLQGGKFDTPDRIFASLGHTYGLVCRHDSRELVPQMYYLPELLLNLNEHPFGRTQSKQPVHDVLAPPWSRNDPRLHALLLRKILESELVSQRLHLWLNLVFGGTQQGKQAFQMLNTFHPLTYENNLDFTSLAPADAFTRQATLDQISQYGQVPR